VILIVLQPKVVGVLGVSDVGVLEEASMRKQKSRSIDEIININK
jgi:hypothetical protein